MDTKWKKWKIVLSFGMFFLGVTLLICNLIPVAVLIRTSGGSLQKDGGNYQESAEFRNYISDSLEELLGVAVGGKAWKFYGMAYSDGYYGSGTSYEIGDSYGLATSYVNGEVSVYEGTDRGIPSEAQALESTVVEQEATYEGGTGDAATNSYDVPNVTGSKNIKEYMEQVAQNKNLRYAIVYRGKLLYTNIEAFAEQTGKSWDGTDFYKELDAEEYNFTLWYNRGGDGKVQIVKDKEEEDVYGDGVYRAGSRWFVPGYANFSVGQSVKDAVIFLAAAKEPRLYITGNYADYGTVRYGGQMYRIYETFLEQGRKLRRDCMLLAAACVLLFLSFLLRKEKRLGDQAIARFMGKLWLEGKVFFFLAVPLLAFVLQNSRELRELAENVQYSGYWYIGDILSATGKMALKGGFLAFCFWMLYLIVLDIRLNRGRQKKPILDGLRAKRLAYPVQGRLARRQRLALLSGIFSLLLCLLVFSYLIFWITSGNAYFYDSFTIFLMKVLLCGIAAVGAALFVVTLISLGGLRRNRRLAEDIGRLSDQILAVRNGNLTEPVKVPEDADLGQAAKNLNEIQVGLETALQEQMRSERMKVELVANVSHDIKTPLTSIISYVELLKQEEGLPDHVKEFIQILGEKSERLETIVKDVFEVSKATAGQLPVKMEELDLGKLLRQTLADMNPQIEESGLIMKTTIPEGPVMIWADGQRLYRVFQNLIQNALQYSLAGSRIFLSLTEEGRAKMVCIKNTSGIELDDAVDFTERFVRGDKSRTDGGSGLGLSIAKSFTEACGGSFHVETDADLFTVTVVFRG